MERPLPKFKPGEALQIYDRVIGNVWVLYKVNHNGFERYWTGETDKHKRTVGLSKFLAEAFIFDSPKDAYATAKKLGNRYSEFTQLRVGRRPNAYNIGYLGQHDETTARLSYKPPGLEPDWKAIRERNAKVNGVSRGTKVIG